jgi:hypothetical protein
MKYRFKPTKNFWENFYTRYLQEMSLPRREAPVRFWRSR